MNQASPLIAISNSPINGGVTQTVNGNKGIRIIPEQYPAKILTLPVGGFLCLACLIALMQWALARSKDKKEESKS